MISRTSTLLQRGSYVTWLIYMWHASFMWVMSCSFVEWLILTKDDVWICEMAHLYVRLLIHMGNDFFTWVRTRSFVEELNCMKDDVLIWGMTHLYARWLIHMGHDSFICEITHICVWHDSAYVTDLLIREVICEVTRSYRKWSIDAWHYTCIRETTDQSCPIWMSKWPIYMRDYSFIWDMSRMTYSCELWLLHILCD